MEIGSAFFLRLAATLSAFGFAHWVTRSRTSDNVVSARLPAIEILSLCVLGFAAALVPTFNPDLFATGGASALPGIWALLLLALALPLLSESRYLDSYSEQGHWLSAWGLCLAVPVTLFGQTEMDRIGSVQDGLLVDLVPVWGALFQPAAFAFALVALASWMAARGSSTLSPRRSAGLLNSILVAATVVVFLGAWHIPWVTDEKLHEVLGQRRWLCALVEWACFAIKVLAVGALAGWLAQNGRVAHRRLTGVSLTGLAAINLLLTWVVLSWRGQ